MREIEDLVEHFLPFAEAIVAARGNLDALGDLSAQLRKAKAELVNVREEAGRAEAMKLKAEVDAGTALRSAELSTKNAAAIVNQAKSEAADIMAGAKVLAEQKMQTELDRLRAWHKEVQQDIELLSAKRDQLRTVVQGLENDHSRVRNAYDELKSKFL